MGLPVAQDVYDYLEGYCIDNTIISEDWINKRITRQVLPYIQKITRLSFTAPKTTTEYQSGNGTNLIYLDRKPINAVEEIKFTTTINENTNLINSIEVVADEGIIIATGRPSEGIPRSVWPKGSYNIKITYSYGFTDFTDPENGDLVDIEEVIICMAAKKVLIQAGARTGGGNVGGQAWNRTHGRRGKYTEIINECDKTAFSILRQYMTGVVGA